MNGQVQEKPDPQRDGRVITFSLRATIVRADPKKSAERAWRDLYLAALFEADLSKLPERIAEAECAPGYLDRDLWYSGSDHDREKPALIGAMRALETLRNIHQCPRPLLRPPAVVLKPLPASAAKSESLPSLQSGTARPID